MSKATRCLLAAALLAGTAAAVVARSAAPPGSLPPPRKGDRLEALLKERRELAREQFEVWEKASQERMQAVSRTRERIGPGGTGDRNLITEQRTAVAEFDRSCEQFFVWARRLLDSEVAVGGGEKAARIAAYEAHLTRVKAVEQRLGKPEYGNWVPATSAKYHRLDAEVLLERARAE